MLGPLVTALYVTDLMELANLASTSVSLMGIFWLYASKDDTHAHTHIYINSNSNRDFVSIANL